MTFLKQYQNAVTMKPSDYPLPPPEAFVGYFYELFEETHNRLPTVLAGGANELFPECTLTFQPMDCRMLLYTREGSGQLSTKNKTCSLERGSLLYFNCGTSPFTVETVSTPWRFIVFLLKGDIMTCCEALFPVHLPLLHPVSPYSPILRGLTQLLSVGTDANLYNKLTDARLVTDILTSLFLEVFQPESPNIKCAPYLLEIRRSFDTSFMKPFRLEDLEKRYHMSKYRICHEFSDTFGISPLKYLNNRRLDAAVSLLLSTDKRVHEIALEVGFENPNHFIHLFKRRMGTTPAAYREEYRTP